MAASTLSISSTLSIFLLTVLAPCFATGSLYTFPSDGVINDVLHDSSFADLMSLPTEAIYQFGDSIADTGNLLPVDPPANAIDTETCSNNPSGRFSDGLIMIDYFAKFLGLPYIDPYLQKDSNFNHGVNFAVGGATALDISTLAEKYNVSPSTNFSLSVQLDWFKSYLDCFNTEERETKFAKALFFMGEIGGNDYNYPFIMGGQSMKDVYKMVLPVIQAIESAIKVIIDLGATRIAVPGNFPVGCMTIYLSLFKTNESTIYDELKCLKNFNVFAQFHNYHLQESIKELQKNYPHVAIVYVDYYAALTEVLQDATILGFDKDKMFKACCGIGDIDYNVDIDRPCGSEGVPICENPYKHLSWDGSHLTQHAYQEMAKWLVKHTPNIPMVT